MGLGSIGTHQALVSSSRNFLVRRGTAADRKWKRTYENVTPSLDHNRHSAHLLHHKHIH